MEDKIKGGLADGKTIEDIAKHHKKSIDVAKSQLAKGIKVEMEHTSDESLAEEIALDHLYEDIYYYVKLAKVEESKSTLRNTILESLRNFNK